MTICTHDGLVGGVFLVKSNLKSEKIAFNKGGVA